MTTIGLSVPRLSLDTRTAIRDNALARLEVAIDCLESGYAETIDDARKLIDEHPEDGTSIIGLSTDEKLDLIDEVAGELGIAPKISTWRDITTAIESTACLSLAVLASRDAHEVLDDLETLLEDKDLPASAVKTGDALGYFRHYAERDEGDWNVFEYRNLESEGVHIDLYKYTGDLGGDLDIYVEEPIPAGSFDPEVETFDAS